jgi:hypothetical protein
MRRKTNSIGQLVIAALLIVSAAICAAAQSRSAGKSNTRDSTASAQPTPKQNARPSDPGQTTSDRAAAAPVSDSTIYTYEFSQPNFLINHIIIEHDSAGRGRITFERKNGEPYVDPLNLSEAAAGRVRSLWEALRFLDSDKSYQTERQYPHLGTMRLGMKQGTRNRTAEFNWTADRDAFALVNEYKRAANQAIFIFDITLARENQPLEAPKLMNLVADYVRRGELSDPQQLVPLLRELSTDERIPLMARNQAGRVLKKIEK